MSHPSIRHIAIIPDGNRRWARANGMTTYEGHQKGFEVISDLGKHIRALGIPVFTVWAFSTENWKREKGEVTYLMQIFERWFESNLKTARKESIRIIHIGRRDRIPASLRKTIEKCESETRDFTAHTLIVALDYGGQDEIVRATQHAMSTSSVIQTPDDMAAHLDTRSLLYPNPDLVIRTSGETRTSGFMLWQTAYSEWIFLNKHLPDMNRDDLDECVAEYEQRQRRFGK